MFRLIILLVALVAGSVAAWLALSMRPASIVTTVVQPAAMQEVLVASADLGLGQALTRDTMRWQSWPESALNPAYISRSARPDAIEALAGSIVRTRIVSGEPIGDDKLVPRNSGFLSAMLRPGKRAVAVRVSAENTAGGFILPNDRVDVLHTTEGEGRKEHVSRAILRNVAVLAIDQTVDENGNDDKAKAKATVIGKTATLELDPQEAEILAAAQATGTLSLALRSAADNGEAHSVDQPLRSGSIQIVRGGRGEVVKVR